MGNTAEIELPGIVRKDLFETGIEAENTK